MGIVEDMAKGAGLGLQLISQARGNLNYFLSPIVKPSPYDFSSRDDTRSQFWIEEVGNHEPGGMETSSKYAHATMMGWVTSDPTQFYNFENSVCGYHYVDAQRNLIRVNPLRHPRKSNLFAIKVSEAKGFQFGKKQSGKTVSRLRNPLAPDAAAPTTGFFSGIAALAAQAGQAQLPTPASVIPEYAAYGRTLVAIEFAPPRYKMWPNDATNIPRNADGTIQEWKRYIEYDWSPKTYVISIQTSNQFLYAEPPASTAASKGFQGEANFIEVTTTFSLKWRNVPEDFIGANIYSDGSTLEYLYPYKLASAAGHVNSVAFAGYPAGTLLLLEPEIERHPCGSLRRNDFDPNTSTNTTGNYAPYYYCDVTLPIIHFDPPHGGSTQGHQLKPWYDPNSSILTYYLVTSNGTATGIRIYGSYDFNQIFTHWST